MPGTPINKNNNNSVDKVNNRFENEQNQSEQRDDNRQQPVVRELTQTDKLNKRLLESLLERMSKTDEFDKFLDSKDSIEKEDADEAEF